MQRYIHVKLRSKLSIALSWQGQQHTYKSAGMFNISIVVHNDKLNLNTFYLVRNSNGSKFLLSTNVFN